MIKSLEIRNYALIEELKIDFSEGLTIITGETGAGKSILLGALGLVMGNRADTKSLYDTSRKCVVEAEYDIRKYDLAGFFEEHSLDYEDDLIIRREILPSGKSRAFINDVPATLPVLQKLSSALIDLHQQFDTLDLQDLSFQLRLLDALAGHKELVREYHSRYISYRQSLLKLKHWKEALQRSNQETDFLQFQLDELDKAELTEGEQLRWENELEVLSHAKEIKRNLGQLHHHLTESEHSIVDQLDQLNAQLLPLEKVGGEVSDLIERFNGLRVELEDLARDSERLADQTEYQPERLQEVQERLDLLYRLQKKHQAATVEELIEKREEFRSRLEQTGQQAGDIEALERQIEVDEEALNQMSEQLHQNRAAVIPDFQDQVVRQLAQLAMEHAQMEIVLGSLPELGPAGKDEVSFLFSANRGGRLQSIKDVASGGELARLTLVTKSLVADAIPLPTLIFDEIDTGVSGDVALKMGSILRELSDRHQVINITHSPQIASKADAHYFVYKDVTEDRTYSRIRLLDEESRIRHIATMLSQSPPTESAIANAKELLRIA